MVASISGQELVIVAVVALLAAAGSQLPKLVRAIGNSPARQGDGACSKPSGRRRDLG